MAFQTSSTDDAVLAELGARLARTRLDRNLTQAALARQAGISKRTLERLEAGSVATQLSSLIRVCRTLGVLDRFDLLLPEPEPSPIAQLKLRGRIRRRAAPSGSAIPANRKSNPDVKPWRWGDES